MIIRRNLYILVVYISIMVNYGNGKIYRIVCNQSGKQYIGATTIPLSSRLSQHKKVFRDAKTCLSREVLEGGDYAIYLIEDFPCERKEQLLARERYFIESNACVNKKIPLRTKHEWYMDNREDVIQRQLIWNRENADKTRAYKRKYVEKLKHLNIEPVIDVIDLEEEYNQYVNAHIQSANTTDVLVHAGEDFINGRIRIH